MKCMLAVVLCAAAVSGLTVPQAGRAKREADTADQRADPSLMLYSVAMPSAVGISNLGISGFNVVHSPIMLRKKRDAAEDAGQDQQADPSLLMYSALPATADVSSIGLKTIPLSSVAVANVHSPFIWRKKRDTADQQADEATNIVYTLGMPLTTNIWGNRMISLLRK